jgi:hypothetical protein
MVVAVALALIGFMSGIGAAIQNYRGTLQRTSRTMPLSLALLVGLCTGAIPVDALPRDAGASVSNHPLL